MSNPEKKPIYLPKAVVDCFEDAEKAQMEIARAAVMDLVRRGKLSPHQGAEILGMGHQDFLAMAADEEIPLINHGQPTTL